MSLVLTQTAPQRRESPTQAVRTILVVDDSRSQRMVIAAALRAVKSRVLEASSGEEALALLASESIDLVLSDWMMPGMSGVDLCRALRAMPLERYVYFILLTAKSDKAAVAEGLGAGADDFLTKPVDGAELHARIHAGERLLALERELRANNRLLSSTLAQLQELYDRLERDLAEARQLQLSLVPQRTVFFQGGRVSLRLRSAGHVGGDMVGYFPIDERRLGLFSIDVSGHGAAAALLTMRLAGLFSGTTPERNIALRAAAKGPEPRPPAVIAESLNRVLLNELRSERYLTMAYAEIDHLRGTTRLVQAGHPHPLLIRPGGTVEILGDGGLPIGLLEEAKWEDFSLKLTPGDRLLLVSDGVVECTNPAGHALGQEGLARVLSDLHALDGQALLDGLIWSLANWAGTEEFDDDVSCALFEYDGPEEAGAGQ